MNCPNCGATLEKDAKFCVVCGTPVPEEAPAQTEGSYTPGSSGSYTPGNSGSYTPGSSGSYAPGNSGSYTPGGSGAYIPGSTGNYGGSGGRKAGANTDHIREYFFGRKSRWPTILIIVGILTIAFGIGVVLILIGLIAMAAQAIMALFGNFAHEDEVDAAWKAQKAVMRERGMEKLNLVQEQMSLIEPLVLVGFGHSPHNSFATAKEGALKLNKGSGVFTFLRNLFFGKRKDGTEYDPEFKLKIGSNGRIRSILQEVTVYAFTENQVLMYTGDVDISTDLVYNEYTAECFYEDIEGVRLNENIYKVLNAKKRRYENRLTNEFVLYLGGCQFQCSVNSEVDASVGEGQFAAMRSLIREKKNG